MYGIGGKYFSIVDEKTGNVNGIIPDIKWDGHKISDDQWEAMFEPIMSGPDISKIASDSKTMYVISDQYHLFKMGQEIWIAEIREDKIWSLYELNRVDLKIVDPEYSTSQEITSEPTSALWFLHQSTGADMAILDYASDDIIIFHGYFGLYVYDLEKRAIIRNLDLQAINCAATQGDNYCDVVVSKDGRSQMDKGSL